MGSGHFDTGLYSHQAQQRKATGAPTFAYDADIKAKPLHLHTAHDSLDPKKIKAPDGRRVRESRDSDEHPESVPVYVNFDDTGSMRRIPYTFQQWLEKLMTTLVVKAGLKDAQICYSANGDVGSARAPLPVG